MQYSLPPIKKQEKHVFNKAMPTQHYIHVPVFRSGQANN